MKKAKASQRRVGRSARRVRVSATSDILASGEVGRKKRRRDRVNPKWAKYHRKLVQLRDHLLDQRAQLAKEANQGDLRFSMHMADSGTDSFDRDFALSLLSSEQNALYEIEAALNRIRNGTYGICEMTGQPIPSARLNAIPWTRFSVEAQRKLEGDGNAARARLGELGSVQETLMPELEEGIEGEEKSPEGHQENSL